jgi:hypothetical protein
MRIMGVSLPVNVLSLSHSSMIEAQARLSVELFPFFPKCAIPDSRMIIPSCLSLSNCLSFFKNYSHK